MDEGHPQVIPLCARLHAIKIDRMTKNWCQKLDTHKSDLCVGLIIFIAALATFLFSPVYVLSDSKYALVVSESLIKHRSFAVDHFALPRLEPQDNGNYVGDGRIYQLEWAGNRLYYYLPPGSSVFSLP